MSGWDQVRKTTLESPWETFWLELYEDPPIGAWIDLQEAVGAALGDPTPGPIGTALAAVGPLVARHNLVDRDGEPLTFGEVARFSGGLYRAVVAALMREIGGAPAGPLPRRKGTSPGRSSPRRRSPSASSSGG